MRNAQEVKAAIDRYSLYSALYVTWIDSHGFTHGWHNPEDDSHELGITESVGMLICVTDDALSLCLSRDEMSGTIDGTISIPLCAVKTVHTLGV
jgi:hypothetical protein